MSPKLQPNAFSYADNLQLFRKYVADESVDLAYLAPPFGSRTLVGKELHPLIIACGEDETDQRLLPRLPQRRAKVSAFLMRTQSHVGPVAPTTVRRIRV
jgi:hypothetical protein